MLQKPFHVIPAKNAPKEMLEKGSTPLKSTLSISYENDENRSQIFHTKWHKTATMSFIFSP